MSIDLFGQEIIKDVLLRDKFIEPPFSVLDAKTGNWQSRKRKWLEKGIKGELGRNFASIHCPTRSNKERLNDAEYTSIFDPALCELMYKWFCPDKGKILDPFAGGSVRGVVAHYLGYYYTGIELRKEQIEANRENALDVLPVNNQPSWHEGDSDRVLDSEFLQKYDFIFSCPPYMDLEVYSDDENDLSNMNDEGFIKKYESIIKKSCNLLKENSFACFVVGDIRDKKTGYYKDLLGITKKAFKNAGLNLYNEAILLNALGSASMRTRQFEISKKLVKTHQNILVFKKA